MSIYGNETWYTGEVQPNNFAAQPYYKAGKQAPATGLPDAFHGADMGLETPPAAGPFGHPDHAAHHSLSSMTPLGPLGFAAALVGIWLTINIVRRLE